MQDKNKKEILDNLISRVYDLILNKNITEEERDILINFKNEIGNKKILNYKLLECQTN